MSIQFKIIYLVFSKKIYFFLFPYKSAGILDCPARIIFVAMIDLCRNLYSVYNILAAMSWNFLIL